jgi:hypothetical protein
MTAEHDNDGTITVTLATPITGAKGEIKEITLRRATADDMRAMDKSEGEIGGTLALAQALSGVHVPFLDRLDAGDFIAVSDVIERFLAPNPENGVTPHDDGSVELTLAQPLEDGDGAVIKLIFKRPKAKHLRAMDKVKGQVAKTLALAAELSGVGVKTLGQIDASAFQEVSRVIAGFLRRSPATGS